MAKQGFGLQIANCHFEGSEVSGMHILATRTQITSGRIVANVPGAHGLFCDAPLLSVSDLEVHAAPSVGPDTFGVDLTNMGYQYQISGVSSLGFGTGLRLKAGAGTVASGEFCGTWAGMELIDGDCCKWPGSIGAACKVCGANHSILHTSGDGKWMISTQNLLNEQLTAYMPPTVVAGAPMMLAPRAALAPASVASAPTLVLPHGASLVHVTGNQSITSVAADVGFALRPVTLVFDGSLTVKASGNLMLAGC